MLYFCLQCMLKFVYTVGDCEKWNDRLGAVCSTVFSLESRSMPTKMEENMANWKLEENGVVASIDGYVATIRIDNPALKNGCDWASFRTLANVYDHIGQDTEARVIVVTGTGEYFYTGGRVDATNPEDCTYYGEYQGRYYKARQRVMLPVIAAVNGHCLKGGMGWLMDADMAVAKSHVTFGYPEVCMGGVPMLVMADSMALPKKIALQAYYSSQPFDTQRAYALGLINAITQEDDFDDVVNQFIHMVIDYPPALIQMTRRAYYSMAAISDPVERTAFAQKMLQEEVLPLMAQEKQQYNI